MSEPPSEKLPLPTKYMPIAPPSPSSFQLTKLASNLSHPLPPPLFLSSLQIYTLLVFEITRTATRPSTPLPNPQFSNLSLFIYFVASSKVQRKLLYYAFLLLLACYYTPNLTLRHSIIPEI